MCTGVLTYIEQLKQQIGVTNLLALFGENFKEDLLGILALVNTYLYFIYWHMPIGLDSNINWYN